MRLENLRNEMDEIDGEIVRLLNERAKIARKIGVVKRQAGLPIVDLEREDAILYRICADSTGDLENEALMRIYRRIMNESRHLQIETKAAEIY